MNDEQENAKLREELRAVKSKNTEISEKMVALEEKWSRNKDKEDPEEEERDTGTKESRKTEISEITYEDRERCEEIFQGKLGVKDAKIQRIFRIGRITTGKVRPVIMEMNEVGIKWELVKRSKKLKNDDDKVTQKIIIAPDLTKREREENDRLREELRHKRQNGGQWNIRKGKVVRMHEVVGEQE
ncbi:hypothetical protein Pcinc_003865 [Petrolisthes cinctipes]|uniref:Uncharacterized protein n=1 Tax=Petrolisthes cinctipes TaxID=88211 RepID=A0AAE1GFS9_PETCI|nr:hypothetical protein Pcinc_003865 [Petrolisthes cinctipes]